MLRVGYGSSLLARGLKGPGIDGIGSYTKELGSALLSHEAVDLQPVIFLQGSNADLFDFWKRPLKLGRFDYNIILSVMLGRAFSGSKAIERHLDIFHSTDHLIPKLNSIPLVSTIMDAVPLSHPRWVKPDMKKTKAYLWKKSVSWSDHIITISEFSKQQIVQHFEISADKVTAIHLGVADHYFDHYDSEYLQAVLEKHGLPQNFYLFLGTLQPRKNLKAVLEAHNQLSHQVQKSCPLIVVGRPGWHCAEEIDTLNALEQKGTAKWLNYLPQEEVKALMQTGRALVFPSLFEGFGLPVVEAFASGLPVITSSTTSLPEVAGDAALLVDPMDPEQICQAMNRVYHDADLVEQLKRAGLVRARMFNWNACAERTLDVYKAVLGF